MKKLKQTINFLTIAISSIVIITSCGGERKKEIAKVKPNKVEISGDLADYLQVVDNEYEITDDWGGNLSIKIKALKQVTTEEIESKDFELSASLLGDNDMPVSGTGEFKMDFGSMDKLMSLLKKGSGEEVIIFKSGLGDYKSEEHADKSKRFEVSSTMKEKEESVASSSVSESSDNSSSSSSESDEAVSESGSENWDQMLDDYEEYTNEYIKFYKQAMKGDASAMSEYPSLMEKATSLSESMQNAQNDNQLSAKQITRMAKIQTRMLQAATNN